MTDILGTAATSLLLGGVAALIHVYCCRIVSVESYGRLPVTRRIDMTTWQSLADALGGL